jgi:hypothetical protein
MPFHRILAPATVGNFNSSQGAMANGNNCKNNNKPHMHVPFFERFFQLLAGEFVVIIIN